MKLTTYSKKRLVLLITLSSMVGCFAGYFIGGDYNPAWVEMPIQSMPVTPVSIVHVDLNPTLYDDPTSDVLFIRAVDGEVYSLRLFENQWEVVDQAPDPGNVVRFENCAADWLDRLLVGEEVTDSTGVRIERPLSLILRCYVVLEDHSLEVWVQSSNAFELMDVLYRKVLFAAVGGALALIVTFPVLFVRNSVLVKS